jgi:hypothetical protein
VQWKTGKDKLVKLIPVRCQRSHGEYRVCSWKVGTADNCQLQIQKRDLGHSFVHIAKNNHNGTTEN